MQAEEDIKNIIYSNLTKRGWVSNQEIIWDIYAILYKRARLKTNMSPSRLREYVENPIKFIGQKKESFQNGQKVFERIGLLAEQYIFFPLNYYLGLVECVFTRFDIFNEETASYIETIKRIHKDQRHINEPEKVEVLRKMFIYPCAYFRVRDQLPKKFIL